MGTVLILLAIPLVLCVVAELAARVQWTLFGPSINRARETPPPSSSGRIVRQPDLPPRLSLHERRRCRVEYHEIGAGGEPPRGLLRA